MCIRDSATATLDITPVNDAPTTTPVTLNSIAEDSGTRLITQAELLANISDIDGGALTVSGLSIATGNGTLVDNGDGTWSYTPATNDNSGVSFNYTISDTTNNNLAGNATLDITPVNDDPIAIRDTFVTDEDMTLVVDVVGQGLLANDSDFENDNLTTTVLVGPANGTITLNPDGTFTLSLIHI